MKLLLSTIIFFFMMTTQAQDLSSHQWQERVLLVISEDTSNVVFKKQLADLSHTREELIERKLVIYQIKPDAFKKGLENEEWKTGGDLFRKYKGTFASFRMILIGLDGGEKLNQTKFLSSKDLFVLIDGMPMRQAEIRKKGR